MKNSCRLILGLPDAAGQVFLLDPEAGRYEISPRTEANEGRLSGMASLKEGGFAALYQYGGKLWATFGSAAYPVTGALTSNWTRQAPDPTEVVSKRAPEKKTSSPRIRRFELFQNGVLVEQRNYTISEEDLAIRPFVIWDDEDEDFLLWMHNVLQSDERKDLLMQQWK